MARSKARAEALLDLVKDLQFLRSREARKVERSAQGLDLRQVLDEQLEFFRVQAEKRGIAPEPRGARRGARASPTAATSTASS